MSYAIIYVIIFNEKVGCEEMSIESMINLKNDIIDWIYQMKDISFMPHLVLGTALFFLMMHGQRDKPILKNISILLGFIPVLTHELGHAMTARFTGGRVDDIHMILTHRNQTKTGAQGYAKTVPRNRLNAILTVFAGYLAPPLMFYLGVVLIAYHYSTIYIAILLFGTLFYLVHTRQIFIPLIIMVFLLSTGYHLSMRQMGIPYNLINIFYNVILGLLLGEMIQSMLIIGRLILRGNRQFWDGKALFNLTLIPSVVWFCIWLFLTCFSIYQSYLLMF